MHSMGSVVFVLETQICAKIQAARDNSPRHFSAKKVVFK